MLNYLVIVTYVRPYFSRNLKVSSKFAGFST